MITLTMTMTMTPTMAATAMTNDGNDDYDNNGKTTMATAMQRYSYYSMYITYYRTLLLSTLEHSF